MHLTVGDKITPLRKVKLHPGFYAFSTYYCLTVYPEWVTDCEYRNISCEENAIVLDNKYKYKNRFSLLQSPLWVRVCWSRSSTATRWPRSGWYILRRRTDGFFRTSITDVDLKALLVELCRTGSGAQWCFSSSCLVSAESERTCTTTSPGFAESKWKWWNFFMPISFFIRTAKNIVQSYTGTTVIYPVLSGDKLGDITDDRLVHNDMPWDCQFSFFCTAVSEDQNTNQERTSCDPQPWTR